MPFLGGGTDAETETGRRTRSQIAPPWNVVVHDDPVTLMSYVTHVFMTVLGYPRAKAHRLMLEVHTRGRSVVWTGGREQAEVYLFKLQGYKLLTTMERAGG